MRVKGVLRGLPFAFPIQMRNRCVFYVPDLFRVTHRPLIKHSMQETLWGLRRINPCLGVVPPPWCGTSCPGLVLLPWISLLVSTAWKMFVGQFLQTGYLWILTLRWRLGGMAGAVPAQRLRSASRQKFVLKRFQCTWQGWMIFCATDLWTCELRDVLSSA